MTSLDDLFKKPLLPNSKRKANAARDPDELYKSIKSNGKENARDHQHATIEDEAEIEEDVEGPELPPGLEEEVPDDEEGRFFGSGVTDNTIEALDFIDGREQEAQSKSEKIDSSWLRKLALNFERKISKNAELRSKFEAEPQKFMGSEADLDADIKALSILSEHPELYEDFAKLGCVSSLVSLLAHENTDIAIDAIEIISELTDEDVEASQTQWNTLVDSMIDADLLDLLFQNIARLNEEVEADRSGVYHVLSVLENLSSRPSIADVIGKHKSIIPWLTSRAQKKEKAVSQNKQYATEILAILLQASAANRTIFVEQEGIEVFLQLLSAYRKRDPAKGTEEEEYVENMFDCMTCCVDDAGGKQKFLDAEGIELALIMLREGKMSRPKALRILDHALGGPEGAACCEKLVEAAGLRTIFTVFMKKHDSQTTEHLLGILASMLRLLEADCAPRIRLLAKFVEKNYEKIDRLFQLRWEYVSKVSGVERQVDVERSNLSVAEQDEMAEEWLSRRLDAGLFSLQSIDVILSWLVAEDDGAREKVQKLLSDRDENFYTIKRTLQEQIDRMNADSGTEDTGLRDMLEALVQFL